MDSHCLGQALGCPPLPSEALLGARDQDRSSVSTPLFQYPKKLLNIPLKERGLKALGLLLHLTAHLDTFAQYVPQTERSHCIFSPVLSLSLFDMTKYSFRKDLESINSCTTAMVQEGTESRGRDYWQPGASRTACWGPVAGNLNS